VYREKAASYIQGEIDMGDTEEVVEQLEHEQVDSSKLRSWDLYIYHNALCVKTPRSNKGVSVYDMQRNGSDTTGVVKRIKGMNYHTFCNGMQSVIKTLVKDI